MVVLEGVTVAMDYAPGGCGKGEWVGADYEREGWGGGG